MEQIDWVGDQKRRRSAAKGGESVAKQELLALLNKVPDSIKSGGTIGDVREWRRVHAECQKVYKRARATDAEVRSAINAMLGFHSRGSF